MVVERRVLSIYTEISIISITRFSDKLYSNHEDHLECISFDIYQWSTIYLRTFSVILNVQISDGKLICILPSDYLVHVVEIRDTKVSVGSSRYHKDRPAPIFLHS